MSNYTLYFLDEANNVIAQEDDQFLTDLPALTYADTQLSVGRYRAVEVWWAGACIYRQSKVIGKRSDSPSIAKPPPSRTIIAYR